MHNKFTHNYFILFTIIESSKKNKKNILVKHTLRNLIFLQFLWINKFIYGFTFYNRDLLLLVFLKVYNIGGFLKITSLHEKKTYKNLLKEHKRTKTSFFIVKTNKGLICEKTCMKNKIGGFLLYKCF